MSALSQEEIVELILAELRSPDSPLLSREIVQRLRSKGVAVTKGQVNSCLYTEDGRRVSQTPLLGYDAPGWSIKVKGGGVAAAQLPEQSADRHFREEFERAFSVLDKLVTQKHDLCVRQDFYAFVSERTGGLTLREFHATALPTTEKISFYAECCRFLRTDVVAERFASLLKRLDKTQGKSRASTISTLPLAQDSMQSEASLPDPHSQPASSPIVFEKLKWQLLPPGQILESVKAYFRRCSDERRNRVPRVFDQRRIEFVCSLKPEQAFEGKDEFDGYLAFVFTSKGRTVMECAWEGNAIYIFRDDWRTLSRLSKSELRQPPIRCEKIIHTGDWQTRLRNALR